MNRVILGAVAFAAAGVLSCAVAAADPVNWNGTWSGQSNLGNPSTVVISGGKVTKWLNNGFGRKVTGSTVGANTVTIQDDGGWKATMTSKDGKSATIVAAGIGQNGSPARNNSVLVKK
ncbi:hypothetical protein [Ancylobacter terrae]|uniref:hypothetical protein n=1 Tax=Ancylobacter sp. sgz301288 TaxID=3342077 RepID=UPI0038583F80